MQNAFLCIIALGASASGLILAAHLQQQGAHAQHAAAPPGAELHGVPRPKKRPKHPDWVHGAPGAAELASARAAKEQIQASLRLYLKLTSSAHTVHFVTQLRWK